MIITLSPSPSLDRTYPLDGFVFGAVNRALASTVEASGKGVNVSRALAAAGTPTVAVLPLGGAEGAQLAGLLAAEGIATAPVGVGQPTRTNITLALPGDTTKVNAPATALTGDDQIALLQVLDEHARRHPGGWICVAGALPPGTDSFLARVIVLARRRGVRTAVDSSGPALAAAAAAGPDLIAPNHVELAEVVGRDPAGWAQDGSAGDVAAAADWARELAALTGGAVLATLGAAGALLYDGGAAFHAAAAPVVPVNTVGAGDALLAGYLHASWNGSGPAAALATAVAWGTAACLLPGTSGPIAATAHPEAVTVRELPG